MACFIQILLLFTTVVASLGETVVEMGFVKFFDVFGDEVPDMAYTGGYILIECRVSECQANDQLLTLIDPDGKVIDSADCKVTVALRVEITETFKFGDYMCNYGEYSTFKKADLRYRFCSPLDSICSDACRKHGNEYCIYAEHRTTQACVTTSSDFYNSYCYSSSPQYKEVDTLYEGIKFCGASTCGKQPRTLCAALVEEKLHKIKTRVLDPDVTDECLHKDPTDDSNKVVHQPPYPFPPYPTVGIGGLDSGRYNDMVSVEVDTSVYIRIPAHYRNEAMDVQMNCILKSRDGAVLYSNSTDISKTEHYCSYSDIFKHSLFTPDGDVLVMDIFKFQCTFVKTIDDTPLADTSYYVYPVVLRYRATAVINPIKTADGQIEALRCEPINKLPPRFVIQSYSWWGMSLESKRGFENETSRELVPWEKGTYACQIKVKPHCKKGEEIELRSIGLDVTEGPVVMAVKKGEDGGNNGCGETSSAASIVIVILMSNLEWHAIWND